MKVDLSFLISRAADVDGSRVLQLCGNTNKELCDIPT